MPTGKVVPQSIVQDNSKRYKYILKLLKDHWKKFPKVYLNELRQNHINKKEKHSENNVLKVGNIIFIKGEENTPHIQWHNGKINKLVTGKDAQVKGAELVVLSKTVEKQYANVQYKNWYRLR